MATGKMAKTRSPQRASQSLSHFFACFCFIFSTVFALFGLSFSDRFWPSVFSASSKHTRICTARLSRVRGRSSPARGYRFGCVCSYMAGHYPGILLTGHIGTNKPKFVPPRWGQPPFDPTQTGLCKFGCVWSSVSSLWPTNNRPQGTH